MKRPLDALREPDLSGTLGQVVYYEAPFDDGVAYYFWVAGYPMRFVLTEKSWNKIIALVGADDGPEVIAMVAEMIDTQMERYDREKS